MEKYIIDKKYLHIILRTLIKYGLRITHRPECHEDTHKIRCYTKLGSVYKITMYMGYWSYVGEYDDIQKIDPVDYGLYVQFGAQPWKCILGDRVNIEEIINDIVKFRHCIRVEAPVIDDKDTYVEVIPKYDQLEFITALQNLYYCADMKLTKAIRN